MGLEPGSNPILFVMGYQLDFSVIIKNLPLFLKGIFLTVEISFFAIIIGLCIGILAASVCPLGIASRPARMTSVL